MPTLDEVCAKALSLPCSPALLPRLITLLEQPHADIEDLAKLIQMDPVLASATVRMANSVFFGGETVADTVGQAVMRLGAKELYRLAALSMASRWMAIEVVGYRWEAGDFCRASLIKALAAEALAQRTGRVDPALAYTCGLVHEIGKLAVAFSCADSFAGVRARCTEGVTWLEAETAELGFNHAAVSARLLAEWRFPVACVVVAANNPPTVAIPAEFRALAGHIHAADHLAAALGVGQGEDAFLYSVDSALLSEQGIEPEVMEATLPLVLERATRLLHGKLNTGKVEF
ncbi:MAG: HDOD domain-containing protein [Opitutus sp.]|nr:HDOD domain-containing protein [Opitutus sp.]MCS6247876.1 HDOD domain-containing protein [Opitutus sp.]MCS6275090.1 HDOD domain-containing protein [Opitutus sp.]MCS6276294.1 HDOD domain-containing protein [Opitutus sp.]MCS6301388.1 HDOD domain-containing protein [Opitutus sp.]